MDTTSPLRIEAIGSMVKRHRCALERGSTVAPAVEHVAAREEIDQNDGPMLEGLKKLQVSVCTCRGARRTARNGIDCRRGLSGLGRRTDR